MGYNCSIVRPVKHGVTLKYASISNKVMII